MTSKQKLKASLSFQPGPIPVDLGGTPVTGMHCETVAAVRDLLGLEKRIIRIVDPYQMLGAIEDDLIEALGVDVLPLWDERVMPGIRLRDFKEWKTPWGQVVLVPGDFNYTVDDIGNIQLYPQGDMSVKPSLMMPASGRFFDAVDRQAPYDYEDLRIEDNTEEFTPIDDVSLSALERRAKEVGDTGRGVIGSFGGAAFGDIALITAVGLKDPKGIRGVADWYMLLATDPDFVLKIFDYQLEVVLENLKKIAAVVGDATDAIYTCGTDFGTQNGTFCSIETFRNMYKPYYIKVNNWIHENTNWKTFKHCCGAIFSFIPDLIESGFDILNPVQWTASGMDRVELKKNFGDRIVFWGGGTNTQNTLPFGTAKEVYDEALECCRIFGVNGGFVFNAIHNIQAKVPPENVVALFKAVQDYNRG
ncbi:MAG: methyltransferase [Oscillospiraceae bacterium]|nr:methyltransferase [Oscillospiraceae bacterium]